MTSSCGATSSTSRPPSSSALRSARSSPPWWTTSSCPPSGSLLGSVDFSNLFLTLKEGAKSAGPYESLAGAKAAGAVTLNYGLFITKVVTFLIVAWVVFMIVRAMAKLTPRPVAVPAAPSTKECPFCLSIVPLKATRCPHCTSALP